MRAGRRVKRIDPDRREAVGEELCDVLAYLLSMANALEIDIADAFARKMVKNGQKYPVTHVE
jgi:NTP pyrophosphatase (non-canonical NTP hydrolase)